MTNKFIGRYLITNNLFIVGIIDGFILGISHPFSDNTQIDYDILNTSSGYVNDYYRLYEERYILGFEEAFKNGEEFKMFWNKHCKNSKYIIN